MRIDDRRRAWTGHRDEGPISAPLASPPAMSALAWLAP
jgi:hypothetical protein